MVVQSEYIWLYPKCSESMYGILVYLRSLDEPVDHIQRDMWHVNMHVLYGAFGYIYIVFVVNTLESHNQNHQTFVILVMFGSQPCATFNEPKKQKKKSRKPNIKYPWGSPFWGLPQGFSEGETFPKCHKKKTAFFVAENMSCSWPKQPPSCLLSAECQAGCIYPNINVRPRAHFTTQIFMLENRFTNCFIFVIFGNPWKLQKTFIAEWVNQFTYLARQWSSHVRLFKGKKQYTITLL